MNNTMEGLRAQIEAELANRRDELEPLESAAKETADALKAARVQVAELEAALKRLTPRKPRAPKGGAA